MVEAREPLDGRRELARTGTGPASEHDLRAQCSVREEALARAPRGLDGPAEEDGVALAERVATAIPFEETPADLHEEPGSFQPGAVLGEHERVDDLRERALGAFDERLDGERRVERDDAPVRERAERAPAGGVRSKGPAPLPRACARSRPARQRTRVPRRARRLVVGGIECADLVVGQARSVSEKVTWKCRANQRNGCAREWLCAAHRLRARRTR